MSYSKDLALPAGDNQAYFDTDHAQKIIAPAALDIRKRLFPQSLELSRPEAHAVWILAIMATGTPPYLDFNTPPPTLRPRAAPSHSRFDRLKKLISYRFKQKQPLTLDLVYQSYFDLFGINPADPWFILHDLSKIYKLPELALDVTADSLQDLLLEETHPFLYLGRYNRSIPPLDFPVFKAQIELTLDGDLYQRAIDVFSPKATPGFRSRPYLGQSPDIITELAKLLANTYLYIPYHLYLPSSISSSLASFTSS